MAGTVKKLQFSEGTDVGAPSDLGIASSTIVISPYANDAAYVTANGAATSGSVYLNTTSNIFKYYTNSAWRYALPATDSADPTKIFAVDLTGNSTGVTATLDFNCTSSRIYTFPDYAGTVATVAGTETHTNKTFTAPLLTAGSTFDLTGAGTVTLFGSAGANNITIGGSSSTVVIAGDLTVQGTTTTLNTATLDVEDVNIKVNKGGNNASSEGAGLEVDRTGTHGSFIYANAATSRWKAGDLGSEVEIATISGAQIITAKDIDGGTASNTSRITLPKDTLANVTALTRKQGTLLYDTTNNRPLYDDGSSLRTIGSGGGFGARNYLSDWSDGSSVGTVSNGNVSDTGNRTTGLTAWSSTNTTNISISSSSSSPIRESNSYLTTGSGNAAAGTTFIETPAFNLDNEDLGKAVVISFDCADSTTSTDWDVCVVRYNSSGTYQEKISVAGTASGGTPASAVIPTGTTNFKGYFIASSTQTDYYALRFRRLAGTVNIKLDTVFVGPQSPLLGFAGTDWISFTPSYTNVTVGNGTSTGYYRRVGSQMQVFTRLTFGSTTSFSGTVSVTIPNSLAIDTNTSPTNSYVSGLSQMDDSGTTTYAGLISINSSTAIAPILENSSATNLTAGGVVNSTNPMTWTTNDVLIMHFSVPISTWTSNVTMADRAVEEYASNSSSANSSDTTSFAYGPDGNLIPSFSGGGKTRRVRFTTPIQATDLVTLEAKTATGVWVPIEMFYDGSGNVINQFVYQGASDYGVGLAYVNSTDVDVKFATYAATAAVTYAGAGIAWSSFSTSYWRVKKVSGGAAVGYPIQSSNVVVPHNSTNTTNAIYSGTYTPTLTNTTNVGASTAYVSNYMRVGNVVTVSGTVDIDPTSTGATELRLSLPVSTTFSGDSAHGVANDYTTPQSAQIAPVSSTALVKLVFTATSTSNRNWSYVFTYLVM